MTRQEAITLIEYIKKTNYKPTEWESIFMQSIEYNLVTPLSYKQTRAMETIYAKATGGGRYERKQRENATRPS